LKSNVEDNYKNGKHWKVFGPKMWAIKPSGILNFCFHKNIWMDIQVYTNVE
jgi:hypothetical protein